LPRPPRVIENTQRDLNIALMNELALIFDRLRISTDTRYQLASEPADERWSGEEPIGHGPRRPARPHLLKPRKGSASGE